MLWRLGEKNAICVVVVVGHFGNGLVFMSEIKTPLKQLVNDDLESPLPSASAKTWAEVERVEPELASLNASFSRNRTLSSPGRMLSSSNLSLKNSRQTWFNPKTTQGNDDTHNILGDPVTMRLVDLHTGKFVQNTSEQEKKDVKRPFHAEESVSSAPSPKNSELDPRATEFAPLSYLRVVHKETSLDSLISGLDNIDETLKSNMEKTSESLKQNLDRIFIWKDAILERHRKLQDLDPAYSAKLENLCKKAEQLVTYVYGDSFNANTAYERRKHAFDLIIQHRAFFQLPGRLKQALASGNRSHIMTEYRNIISILQAQVPNAVVDKVRFTVDELMNQYLREVYRQITDTGTSKEVVEMLVNFLLQIQPSRNHLERILELKVESSIDKMQSLYDELVQVNKKHKELDKKFQAEEPHLPTLHFAANEPTLSSADMYVTKRTKIVQNLCITYVDCLSELERFTLRLVTSKNPLSKLAISSTVQGKSGAEDVVGSATKYISDITLSISKRVSNIFSSCLSFLLNFCSDNRLQLSLEEIIELRSCQKNISEQQQNFFDVHSARLYIEKLVSQYFDDMLKHVCSSLKVVEDIVDENFIYFSFQVCTEESPFSIYLKEALSTLLKLFDKALNPPRSIFEQIATYFGQFFKVISNKILEKERNIPDRSETAESVLCYWNHLLLVSLAKECAGSDKDFGLEVALEEEVIRYLMKNSSLLLNSCVLKIVSSVQEALVLLRDIWTDRKLGNRNLFEVETQVASSWLQFRKNIACLHVVPASARMTILESVLNKLKEVLNEFQFSSDMLKQKLDREYMQIFRILLLSVTIADILASCIPSSYSSEIRMKKDQLSQLCEEYEIDIVDDHKKTLLYSEDFWSLSSLLTQ